MALPTDTLPDIIRTNIWIPEKSDEFFFSKHQNFLWSGGILNGSVGNSKPTFI
jgi:hypothetical protein